MKEIYQDAFTTLFMKMNNLNLNLSQKIMYAEFEQAIHSVLIVVFSNVIRKGFRFHFG
jgi:hypothetical protein